MARPRNKQSFLSVFSGFDATLRSLFVDQPLAWLTQAREKLRNLPKTNFDLGCDFAERGLWKDAAFRFRVALHLQPQFPQAYYNLGCSQVQLGQRKQAEQSFRMALKQQPTYQDALFMLSALNPEAVPADRRPQRMPSTLVKQFFGILAPQYDAMEANNRYNGARVAYDALRPLTGERKDLVVLDLGAGTGIASRPWRPVAKELVGVDFVTAMADAAKQVKVAETALFDRVIEEDIYDIAGTTAPVGTADVVLLISVAQFLGNLQPLLTGLAPKLKSGALLAVTIEPFSAPAGFGVNIATGRFGHHPDYVKQQASQAGLTLVQDTRVQLYPEFAAQLFVFKK